MCEEKLCRHANYLQYFLVRREKKKHNTLTLKINLNRKGIFFNRSSSTTITSQVFFSTKFSIDSPKRMSNPPFWCNYCPIQYRTATLMHAVNSPHQLPRFLLHHANEIHQRRWMDDIMMKHDDQRESIKKN